MKNNKNLIQDWLKDNKIKKLNNSQRSVHNSMRVPLSEKYKEFRKLINSIVKSDIPNKKKYREIKDAFKKSDKKNELSYKEKIHLGGYANEKMSQIQE